MNTDLGMKIAIGLMQYIALLFSLTVHESAHALSAHFMGDDTAKHLGRISLNPIAHIDIVGTVIIPLFMIFFPSSIPLFGWAKPVPINPLNFRDREGGISIVSFAGPLSNLIIMIIAIVLYKVVMMFPALAAFQPLRLFLFYLAAINLILAVFNLLPVPPLDGSGVLAKFIGLRNYENYVSKIGPYGFIILLGLIYFNVFDIIFRPFYLMLIRIMS
ncbi:peptidase M50 [Thermotomaculum hydrothermale]|uniref:Peptidase M50 n=1 Tax=Thermotomaculum hydrothermale TaxID=981385 RepID=A0A7R6PGC4_9BACT|nr:site-2 protease family protein [Thermotomaculum hydrothermale]BBB33243.1 peptidase M50 [Thermotomaculum hydrothermale]